MYVYRLSSLLNPPRPFRFECEIAFFFGFLFIFYDFYFISVVKASTKYNDEYL